jgi:signal transduction histidine kinase
MDTVSMHKDYSLRVDKSEENELGAVIDGFNRMLEQIQLRDNKLAKYSTHLEKTIETRTLQLTDANKKRILWLETMARFLRHELKNSSVGIKTSLDLIERRSVEKQKVDVYLARARKSMDNMNALLKSAGDASTLEASLYKEKHHPLDFSSTISSQMETYVSIYPGISMTIDCSPGIFVLGNENRLNQLLDNLISNAVEHSDPQATINVSVKQHLRGAKLIVKNKGAALPSEKKTMFDLFVSLRTPGRKTDDNFGLGLYIVKLITESHGGQVNAYDLNDETGAVFEVTLPLVNLD